MVAMVELDFYVMTPRPRCTATQFRSCLLTLPTRRASHATSSHLALICSGVPMSPSMSSVMSSPMASVHAVEIPVSSGNTSDRNAATGTTHGARTTDRPTSSEYTIDSDLDLDSGAHPPRLTPLFMLG
ncbi:hypothetical protein GSI_10628 [Ganoderma sinense ZZ0214-1]|uniref:Uncharacterized protein n=1 Tax=Ganoderma sinense ZZ0214-1 TaxID=1077348 RepID=A0A2G8S1P2_9APHY|nr:hypothetical protein GSI_10628 [Ganoderma sinense ZZ0214-1]